MPTLAPHIEVKIRVETRRAIVNGVPFSLELFPDTMHFGIIMAKGRDKYVMLTAKTKRLAENLVYYLNKTYGNLCIGACTGFAFDHRESIRREELVIHHDPAMVGVYVLRDALSLVAHIADL